MSLPVDIDAALRDPQLLGAALGDPEPWCRTWLPTLKAGFGLPLTKTERKAFAAVSGGRKPPQHMVQELWAIIGRRGGKSRMAAALAVYIAAFVDHSGKLAPGETGYVLVLAASVGQAQAVFRYIGGFLKASPLLSPLIEGETATEIRLAGNVAIAVHTNSFRTVRGRTLLAAVFDESGFWRDEGSAEPDVEIYRAVLPALATTGGMLIGISSPYRKAGLLFTKHRDHFGKDSPDVLVIAGGTEAFNPTIDRRVIARARESDPESARAEWDGEFRADIAALLDEETIEAAIDRNRPLELPPREGVVYHAFTDASAGRHDAFTLCIGHKEGETFVADVIRGRRAPFNPAMVAMEYATLIREYRCGRVTGDNYSGEWVAQAFRDASVDYRRSDMPRSGLYLEAIPQFMRGQVSIPDLPIVIRELRLLERRTNRSGKDQVDHPVGGSDDHANALAGCIRAAMPKRERRVQGFAGPELFERGFDGGQDELQPAPRTERSTFLALVR